MQTIDFLPDRLNTEPVIFRGFTAPEMGLAGVAGLLIGGVITLPLIPLVGWVIIPTGMLLTPLLLIGFGGHWMVRIKRGKPENYIWQRLEEKKHRLGYGDRTLIFKSQSWSLHRKPDNRKTKF
ncbi:TIGR03750 family conjugal transfer protein [Rouxiella badensis]|uniref:TIGR03750 family conjugal transfer protein n=1 Tax=Rouxiella badensis TaxID=1646377 RepID=UPI001D15354E|nr:TIGR03750 family conjugal transfer protein [Rouxiella badensis]MCC3701663.1 TIGR03750 family conjugal transfer protein [Rouxiella badensis]